MEGLKEYGINNIIAIDDNFNHISEETKVSTLDERMVEIIDTINNFDDEFFNYVQENSEHYMSDFFEVAGYEQDVVNEILAKINQFESASYSELVGIEGIKFRGCSPNADQIEDLLRVFDIEDERTLIILDRKLAGNNEQEGKMLLKSLLLKISKYLTEKGNFFLILYSSDPKELFTYDETVRYLKEDLTLADDVIVKIALHMNFLKKDASSESDFINVLRKSQKANYVNSYTEIFGMSIESLRKRVWDLNHNESLLHYDYLVEGQQIDQIIFNIFVDKFKKRYMDFMNVNYGKFINPIRNSIQKYENNRVAEEKVEIDKAPAKYRFIKEVNSAIHGGSNTDPVFSSDDITFGDIITIGSSNYLIVSQNCDITIRQNGDRSVQSFQLIKVKENRETINAEWLINFFIKYCNDFKPEKIKLNSQGKEFFENTFHNPSADSELRIMGFEAQCLKMIEDSLDMANVANHLRSLDFKGCDKDLSVVWEYVRDTKVNEIFTVPCFWLDALLIRKTNGNVINEETIDKSKEIRLATKRRIKKDYNDMIGKLRLLSKNSLIQAFDNNLLNPLVKVEPLFGEGDVLNGFKLHDVSRDKKLKNHVARAIHLEMIAKQTREAVNESIPI